MTEHSSTKYGQLQRARGIGTGTGAVCTQGTITAHGRPVINGWAPIPAQGLPSPCCARSQDVPCHFQSHRASSHDRHTATSKLKSPFWLWAGLLVCLLQHQAVWAGEGGHLNAFSFDRGPVNCVQNPKPFTYIIASDVQFWFWIRNDNDPHEMGEITNLAQLALWNKITSFTWPNGKPVAQPSALVINGDCTNFGEAKQWNRYRQLYDTMDLPVFPGLGNHDYDNNVAVCFDGGIDGTTCARRSIQVLRQTASGISITSKTFRWFASLQGPLTTDLHSRINAFDWGSGAYSWDEGNYHFIMLHFHPAHHLDLSSYNIAGPVVVTPSYDFLDKELAKTKATGRIAVLFIHDVDDHWVVWEDDRFMKSLADMPVAAVFCGHWHASWGQVYTLRPPNTTQAIPVYRSGSSEWQTSYVAEFTATSIQLQLMSSESGGFPVQDMDFYLSMKHGTLPGGACNLSAATPAPASACPPNWQQEGNTCRAPCPQEWELKGGRCKRRGCGSWLEKDGALCYPPCRDGYHGRGPACWQDCPAGWSPFLFMCINNECARTQEKQGGLCYPSCRLGYKGAGPACWSVCPDGYKDDGMFCRRPFQVVYKDCCCTPDNLGCCNNCPSGFTDMGCKCRRSADGFVKSAYWRGTGSPAMSVMLRNSYGRGAGLPLWASIDQDHYDLPIDTPSP